MFDEVFYIITLLPIHLLYTTFQSFLVKTAFYEILFIEKSVSILTLKKGEKKCLLSNAWLQKSHSTSYPTGWVKRFPLNLRVQTNNFPSRLSFDIFNANNGKAHRSTSIFNAIFMSDNDIWNYIHTTSLVWTNNTSFEKILTACEGFVI